MYIDVHCHLDLCKDIDKAVESARKKNVGIIIANGINIDTNRKVLSLMEKFDIVRTALGIYPIDALKMSVKGIDEEIAFIRRNREKIVAIGEVGLDFKESEERKKQEEIFSRFVKLSKEINKPIIVHSRQAEEKCIEILEREMAKKVVMHCFCGSKKLIKRIIENSWMLSVPTNVNYSTQFQELVKDAPIFSLLCETDSPFLHPLRQRDNSPENVVVSYNKIGEIKNLRLDEVEGKIEGNFKKLFGV